MYSELGARTSLRARCRIRASPAQRLLTAPRGFSQPTTPFIGSWRLGIPRAPFVAPRPLPRGRATRRILRSTFCLTLFTRYALVPVLVPSREATLPACSDPGAPRSRRIVPPRRPTRPPCHLPGRPHRGSVCTDDLKVLVGSGPWTAPDCRDTKTGPRP